MYPLPKQPSRITVGYLESLSRMMVTWGVMHNLCLTFNLYCIYIKITAITERISLSQQSWSPPHHTDPDCPQSIPCIAPLLDFLAACTNFRLCQRPGCDRASLTLHSILLDPSLRTILACGAAVARHATPLHDPPLLSTCEHEARWGVGRKGNRRDGAIVAPRA